MNRLQARVVSCPPNRQVLATWPENSEQAYQLPVEGSYAMPERARCPWTLERSRCGFLPSKMEPIPFTPSTITRSYFITLSRMTSSGFLREHSTASTLDPLFGATSKVSE